MSAISVETGKLTARYTPYALREKLKAVPGARWDRAAQCWRYPATPDVARALRAALPDARLDDVSSRLLSDAVRIDQAQGHKTAGELPAIPLTVLPPWHHQLQAYHFAKDLPAAMLALDMGTGKSRVVVDLVVNLGLHRALILCPLSVVEVWRSQFATHAATGTRVLCLGDDVDNVRAKARQLAAVLDAERGPLVVVVNYESAWREPLASLLLGERWPMIVLDESHRIKAPGGKASLFCSRLRERGERRLCLTGTPMPHSPFDVYAQYRFLDPGVFGTSVTAFRARYAVMGGFQQHQIVGWRNEQELRERFYRLAFVVQAGEVLDLPPVTHVQRFTRLTPDEARVYASLAADLIADVQQGKVTASNALVRLLKLAQITGGYVRTDEGAITEVGDSKRRLLADVLEDLPRAEPVVIFGRFHHDLDAAAEVCREQGRRYAELSGRCRELAAWQAGEADVLGVQVQSGGVGIDLTRARYCIYYSVNWSLGDYEQSLCRVHRPGQTRPVTYVHLLARGTVDEDVYDALGAKREVIDAVLEKMGGERG